MANLLAEEGPGELGSQVLSGSLYLGQKTRLLWVRTKVCSQARMSLV